MPKTKFTYSLGVQCTLPSDWHQNMHFLDDLLTLREEGFEDVELNIADFEEVDGEELQSFLNGTGLRMTQFATGLTAKTRGLSLSSADRQVWERSIQQAGAMMEFAAHAGCGIIVGFLKGGPAADPSAARDRFSEALARIVPRATELQVPVLVEATNRYESVVANNLAAAADLIRPFDSPFLRILPDTFHMNIEEADSHAALKAFSDYFDALHISDNNRLFPGFGAIDFGRIFTTLEQIGYKGRLAIEGNLNTDFRTDIRTASAFLAPLLPQT